MAIEGAASREVFLGTAGWSIPRSVATAFPGEGSHLERYARVLQAAEINSSFHRSHRLGTYQRWAAAVPRGFRFAVKLPKTISHTRRLVDIDELLDGFAAETAGLGEKLEVVLVQLPPKLVFDPAVASAFFGALAERFDAAIACEPRNPTWFTDAADACLRSHRVARVAAHPVLAPGGERPGGWSGLRYHRLHGAPRLYYSTYDEADLKTLAASLGRDGASARQWCIFDNTASGAAAADALRLRTILDG